MQTTGRMGTFERTGPGLLCGRRLFGCSGSGSSSGSFGVFGDGGRKGIGCIGAAGLDGARATLEGGVGDGSVGGIGGAASLGDPLAGLDKTVAGDAVGLGPKLLTVHLEGSFLVTAVVCGGLLIVIVIGNGLIARSRLGIGLGGRGGGGSMGRVADLGFGGGAWRARASQTSS